MEKTEAQGFLLAKQQLEKMQNDEVRELSVKSCNMQMHLYPALTEFVVIVVHGLYQSPKDMQGIINYFFNAGSNVVAPLLAGHWRCDKKAYYNIDYKIWQEQISDIISISSKLGKKVILVGHSAGALLIFDQIVQAPKHKFYKTILFAPALGLSRSSEILLKMIYFEEFWHFVLSIKNKIFRREMSEYDLQKRPAIAAANVKKLIENIFGMENERRTSVYQKIKTPILLISSLNDGTVSHSEVLKLKSCNPEYVKIMEYPKSSVLKHDNIQRSKIDVQPGAPIEWINPDFDKLLHQITVFIK